MARSGLAGLAASSSSPLRSSDESPNLLSVLRAGGLYAGGNIDSPWTYDRHCFRDIVRPQTSGQHDGHPLSYLCGDRPVQRSSRAPVSAFYEGIEQNDRAFVNVRQKIIGRFPVTHFHALEEW